MDQLRERLSPCFRFLSAHYYKGVRGVLALETRRARELHPLWREMNAGTLDIHSTSCAYPPLLVVKAGTLRRYAECYSGLPIAAILTGIIKHFTGQPALAFYSPGAPHAILECGRHDCAKGPEIALQSVQQWLCNLGLQTPHQENRPGTPPKHYAAFQPVWLPQTGETFCYHTPIAPFAKITEGQKLAVGDRGTVFKSPASGYALMAPSPENPLPTTEEFFFLASLQDTPSFSTSQPR